MIRIDEDTIILTMDGNQWCATREGFEDLATSDAGFGDSPSVAVADLFDHEGKPIPVLDREEGA